LRRKPALSEAEGDPCTPSPPAAVSGSSPVDPSAKLFNPDHSPEGTFDFYLPNSAF
jgi:hypothetical protein